MSVLLLLGMLFNAYTLVAPLRVIKSDAEVAVMRRAAEISAPAHTGGTGKVGAFGGTVALTWQLGC